MNPIIKIEVEHMRQSMACAFSERLLKMDDVFKQAITQACKPEAVQEVVDEAARRYLRQAMDEEVKSYLLYGEGRNVVRQQVMKRLKAEFSQKRCR